MKKEIVIATGNLGKLDEFRKILGNENYCFKTLSEIGFNDEIIEDGDTFEANAIIKAQIVTAYCKNQFPDKSFFVLADDSGLEVDALGGAPGIYTARFAGVGASDEENLTKLLDALVDKENRFAKFVCVLALHTPTGQLETYRGEIKGVIAQTPRGDHGFGYDPIFAPIREVHGELNHEKTFAQMSHQEKKADSHRGRAIQKLAKSKAM